MILELFDENIIKTYSKKQGLHYQLLNNSFSYNKGTKKITFYDNEISFIGKTLLVFVIQSKVYFRIYTEPLELLEPVGKMKNKHYIEDFANIKPLEDLFKMTIEESEVRETKKFTTPPLILADQKSQNNIIENAKLQKEVSFGEILEGIGEMLTEKNKRYGSSALDPLYIFNGKTKVGQRMDDKLARIKNSETLRLNDVADLMGYLTLVCKENNWTKEDILKLID